MQAGPAVGGQRQRVAMGRAIVREPKAFLMDSRCRTSTQLRVQMRATSPRSSRGSA
jgi:ABC-type sugar transport system ATPase subunit